MEWYRFASGSSGSLAAVPDASVHPALYRGSRQAMRNALLFSVVHDSHDMRHAKYIPCGGGQVIDANESTTAWTRFPGWSLWHPMIIPLASSLQQDTLSTRQTMPTAEVNIAQFQKQSHPGSGIEETDRQDSNQI